MMTVSSALATVKFDEDHLSRSLRNSFHHLRAGCERGIATAIFVVMVAPLSIIQAEIGQSSAPPPQIDLAARPCKSTAVGSKRPKGANKNRSQKPGEENGNVTNACVEVHSTALEVQEYLQARGREDKWNLIEEHVGEDAWTFTRKLEKDELLQFTKRDANNDGVKWTSGVAFVQLRTTELASGFVRVQVSARFQGYGQSPDRFAPPKESWPLSSNAGLENHLISVLEAHFKNAS
jgi:hypothetical protein